MMKKKIVIVTSGQPSLNPRVVKEADSLTNWGYDILVIYQYWNQWGTEFDNTLLASRKWKAIRVGGSPTENRFSFWQTRIFNKLIRNLLRLWGRNSWLSEFAIGRCTQLLQKEAKKHKAAIYIAHNLSALPAAVHAARIHKAKCGFDAEDFHRFETSNNLDDWQVKMKIHIENKYFPSLNYLSVSSPEIGRKYRAAYPLLSPHTLLNVFPKFNGIPSKFLSKPVKLFWFSQTIGTDRGLELLLECLKEFSVKDFEIHLLGEHNAMTLERLKLLLEGNYEMLFCYKPVHPDDLIQFASNFDVGVAAETGYPENRNLCLTNKLFVYIQAGLGVLASRTQAQDAFLNTYKGIGLLYDQSDPQNLITQLRSYKIPDNIKLHKENSYATGQNEINWDSESEKLKTLINSTLV